MYDKYRDFILAILAIVILMGVREVQALRTSRPVSFTLPWTEEKVEELNSVLQRLFHMQQGRFELDEASSSKTDANVGEVWLIKTGNTTYLQWKGTDTVFTITPDGR